MCVEALGESFSCFPWRKCKGISKTVSMDMSLKFMTLKRAHEANFDAIEVSNTFTHDTRSISEVFKNLFSNLAESLLHLNFQNLLVSITLNQ